MQSSHGEFSRYTYEDSCSQMRYFGVSGTPIKTQSRIGVLWSNLGPLIRRKRLLWRSWGPLGLRMTGPPWPDVPVSKNPSYVCTAYQSIVPPSLSQRTKQAHTSMRCIYPLSFLSLISNVHVWCTAPTVCGGLPAAPGSDGRRWLEYLPVALCPGRLSLPVRAAIRATSNTRATIGPGGHPISYLIALQWSKPKKGLSFDKTKQRGHSLHLSFFPSPLNTRLADILFHPDIAPNL